MSGPVRIGLTISGAVSLGAYEGGALAALLLAVQELHREQQTDPPVVIDAMGGASAGSITAMLAARTLHAGLDPVHVMAESWVRRDSLAALRTKDKHAPLSVDALRAVAIELLDAPEGLRGRPKQDARIRIHMALACLRGLNYRIGRLKGRALDASTFLDWGTFELMPKMTIDDYTEPPDAAVIDFALASGANALGFPPRRLNRLALEQDRKRLEKTKITNLPSAWKGWLWYTDGGTIDNEPLGRTFDIANDLDAGFEGTRLHLLIHPHPTAPPSDDRWAKPGTRPPWITTLARSEKIQRTQSLYGDLLRAEKTNSRIFWKELFARGAAGPIADDPDTWLPILRQVLGAIEGEKAAIDAREGEAITAESTPVPEEDVRVLLRRVLDRITGLTGKNETLIDVVSPLLLPEARERPIEDLLAGEFLGHFGGFLDEPLRWNDFALGYRSMRIWLDRLEEIGVDAAAARRARAVVDERFERGWNTAMGEATLKSIPSRAKWQFRRVALHTASVAGRELLNKGDY